MLTTILTGILIGLCVSVPVGPLGVLCIQRTVTRGRGHGIVTGLGATTSDLVYALLVGFSMGFIIEFIEAHQLVIQVIGSIIIGGFGLHIYTKDPLKQLEHKKRPHSKGDLFSDYITAFGLCFSNPMIIFLFIGLFARFNIVNPDAPIQTIVGMASILVGATLWWLTLTMLVNLISTKLFKEKGLEILNKITGAVLIVLGIAGIVSAVI
ncbi:MAG: LysE family transporter [Paludibacteraceae bacterium]|nr:LysE family transporter [Paludibacteraceae bacterium]